MHSKIVVALTFYQNEFATQRKKKIEILTTFLRVQQKDQVVFPPNHCFSFTHSNILYILCGRDVCA